MKAVPWILVGLLLGLITWMLLHSHKQVSSDMHADTVIIYDTVLDTILQPIKKYIVRVDTTYLPILVASSDNGIEGDSVPVVIPITSKEYRTDKYRAVISGYNPNLDYIETYCKKEMITLKPKKKRWGVGLQVGYGIYPGGKGFYYGGGISYNIMIW